MRIILLTALLLMGCGSIGERKEKEKETIYNCPEMNTPLVPDERCVCKCTPETCDKCDERCVIKVIQNNTNNCNQGCNPKPDPLPPLPPMPEPVEPIEPSEPSIVIIINNDQQQDQNADANAQADANAEATADNQTNIDQTTTIKAVIDNRTYTCYRQPKKCNKWGFSCGIFKKIFWNGSDLNCYSQ
jgi:hypothetical protein